MKKIAPHIFFLALVFLPLNSAYAVVFEIGFAEGTVPNYINEFYDDISFQNFRFFNWSGNSGDDYPFTDSWGGVIDSGLFPDLVGHINFPNAVDFFEVDGVINNSDFSSAVEWNMTALDSGGNVVDFISSGLFNPADQNGSLHILSTLRVEASQSISRILIDQQIELGRHKGWGLDTVRFGLNDTSNVIPEPTTFALLSLGILGLPFVRRKR
ncbi:PEP-CTERM sorting domain-containing protein [Omnitrophica bacterium]|nr:PEP-CTERM sorting domain-containing protein [Candidatus Omnitrophota bacterium]